MAQSCNPQETPATPEVRSLIHRQEHETLGVPEFCPRSEFTKWQSWDHSQVPSLVIQGSFPQELVSDVLATCCWDFHSPKHNQREVLHTFYQKKPTAELWERVRHKGCGERAIHNRTPRKISAWSRPRTWEAGIPQSRSSTGHNQLPARFTPVASTSVRSWGQRASDSRRAGFLSPICSRACGSSVLLCALKRPGRSSFHFISSSRGLSEVKRNKHLLGMLGNLF